MSGFSPLLKYPQWTVLSDAGRYQWLDFAGIPGAPPAGTIRGMSSRSLAAAKRGSITPEAATETPARAAPFKNRLRVSLTIFSLTIAYLPRRVSYLSISDEKRTRCISIASKIKRAATCASKMIRSSQLSRRLQKPRYPPTQGGLHRALTLREAREVFFSPRSTAQTIQLSSPGVQIHVPPAEAHVSSERAAIALMCSLPDPTGRDFSSEACEAVHAADAVQ